MTNFGLATFGLASLLPFFQGTQAWPYVQISDLVDQSSGLSIVDLNLCGDEVGR